VVSDEAVEQLEGFEVGALLDKGLNGAVQLKHADALALAGNRLLDVFENAPFSKQLLLLD